jgi:hypothetical protein
MLKDSALSTLSEWMGESGSEKLKLLCPRVMETADEALEENHLKVAQSLLAPARVALALQIPVPEMTFPTNTTKKHYSSIWKKMLMLIDCCHCSGLSPEYLDIIWRYGGSLLGNQAERSSHPLGLENDIWLQWFGSGHDMVPGGPQI